MNELEKLTKEKLAYMEKYIENGGTVENLKNDQTFLKMFDEEKELIRKRNNEIDGRQMGLSHRKNERNDNYGRTAKVLD